MSLTSLIVVNVKELLKDMFNLTWATRTSCKRKKYSIEYFKILVNAAGVCLSRHGNGIVMQL